MTIETPDHERGIPRQGKEKTVERTEEGELPQGRGDSLVPQLDSALNQAEQFRDQQIQPILRPVGRLRSREGAVASVTKDQDRADRAALGQGGGD